MSFTTSTPVEAILRMANLHTVTKEKWKSLTKEVLSDLVMHFVAECKMNTDKVNTYIDTMATKITNPQDQLLTKLTEHMNKMQDELNTLQQSQSDPKPALNTPPSLEVKEKMIMFYGYPHRELKVTKMTKLLHLTRLPGKTY